MPWFNEGCSKLLDKKKNSVQWAQHPSKMNRDNYEQNQA
jgi:hypothetical protein